MKTDGNDVEPERVQKLEDALRRLHLRVKHERMAPHISEFAVVLEFDSIEREEGYAAWLVSLPLPQELLQDVDAFAGWMAQILIRQHGCDVDRLMRLSCESFDQPAGNAPIAIVGAMWLKQRSDAAR